MNRWEKRNPNTGKIRMRTTNRPETPKNSWKIGSRWHGSEGDKGNHSLETGETQDFLGALKEA